jgi:hypothetical protein
LLAPIAFNKNLEAMTWAPNAQFLKEAVIAMTFKKTTIAPTRNGESHLSMNKRGLGAPQ